MAHVSLLQAAILHCLVAAQVSLNAFLNISLLYAFRKARGGNAVHLEEVKKFRKTSFVLSKYTSFLPASCIINLLPFDQELEIIRFTERELLTAEK